MDNELPWVDVGQVDEDRGESCLVPTKWFEEQHGSIQTRTIQFGYLVF